ncbi:hypothetical protein [Carp edema virus]|nr:hypothetical protein [Carp edema virus]
MDFLLSDVLQSNTLELKINVDFDNSQDSQNYSGYIPRQIADNSINESYLTLSINNIRTDFNNLVKETTRSLPKNIILYKKKMNHEETKMACIPVKWVHQADGFFTILT